MDNIIVDDEIGKVFLYIAGFGFSDLFITYFNFKKSHKINPNSELPLINIANILSLKDKNKLAIKFYEKAKKINPDNQQIDENIIICNFRLKNFEWVEKKILDLQN